MINQSTLWGSVVVTEVSSAAPDATPVWVDISDHVSFRDVGQITTFNGRQTDLAGDEPAQLTLAVRNDDQSFSTGNNLNLLRQAREIRVRESFGLTTFDIIRGYIQTVTTSVPMDLTDGSQAEITVSITAVDKLGRLRSARKFMSTLTEYIRYQGSSTLVGLWPLNEVAGPPFNSIVGAPNPLIAQFYNTAGGTATTTFASPPYLQPAAGPALFVDDIATLKLAVDLGASAGSPAEAGVFVFAEPALPVVLSASTLTAACWVYPDTSRSAHAGFPAPIVYNGVDCSMQIADDLGGGGWVATFYTQNGTNTATLNLPSPRMNAWSLIALQMSLPSGAVAAYVHNIGTVTGTLSGSPPASATFGFDMILANGLDGAMSLLQIYLGTYTQATHNAQLLAAMSGLEQQATGDRINTILNYAGVPSGLRAVDRGVAHMSRASLAGKDPLTCLEEARRTELGRLFMSGDGHVVFRDRTRTYNV